MYFYKRALTRHVHTALREEVWDPALPRNTRRGCRFLLFLQAKAGPKGRGFVLGRESLFVLVLCVACARDHCMALVERRVGVAHTAPSLLSAESRRSLVVAPSKTFHPPLNSVLRG